MPSNDDILAELSAMRSGDVPTRGGRNLAHVHDPGLPCLAELAADAHAAFAAVNADDTAAFPSVVLLENDVVSFVAGLLGGGPNTRGSLTGCDNEAVLLAARTARDHARATRGVTAPELVVPTTAHPAFRTAAHYLGMRLVTVPVHPVTCVPAATAMAAAITDRTALVAVSAPSPTHGVLDPVADVAAAAAERGVWCHVEAHAGGMVLPFLRRLGHELPDFDLSVPGVRSISVDLRGYGFVDAGASVVLYRDSELRRHQYLAIADRPGHPALTTTSRGARSAGPLAAVWAVLRRLGTEGYTELAASAIGAAEEIVAGIGAIDGLRVLGDPVSTLVCVASDQVDVLHVLDEMRQRGWFLLPQLSSGPHRRTLRLTVTPATGPQVPELLDDLADAVRAAAELPSPDPDPRLLRDLAELDADALATEDVKRMVNEFGPRPSAGTALSDRMAPMFALLDAIPPRLRERFLTDFADSLYHGSVG